MDDRVKGDGSLDRDESINEEATCGSR